MNALPCLNMPNDPNGTRIAAMIDLARSEAGIPVLSDDLDADAWLLNVVNGTLDYELGTSPRMIRSR